MLSCELFFTFVHHRISLYKCGATELLHKADGGDMSDLHDKCHEEYEQLREEFERYKLRAQSVLKNIATKVWSMCRFDMCE